MAIERKETVEGPSPIAGSSLEIDATVVVD
jgi:hypothetical protein